MRKVIILTLALLLVFAFSSIALGKGWHKIGATDNPQNLDSPDTGYWRGNNLDANNDGDYDDPGDEKAVNAHTDLAGNVTVPSSNKCKVCHATHEGDNVSSFKLLHDAARGTECDYCHKPASGKTDKKAYTLESDWSQTIAKGEHSLAYIDSAGVLKTNIQDYGIPGTTLPIDSGVNKGIIDNGLSCGNCHSVHGANAISIRDAQGNLTNADYNGKILKNDPAGNGNKAEDGIQSVADVADNVPVVEGNPTGDPNDDEIQAAFCGDCHNKNVNWDRGGSDTNEGERPHGLAHALGSVDGKVDIYGNVKDVLDIYDADGDLTVTPTVAGKLKALTCSSCHKSGADDNFPHQSKSHKFLGSYTRTTDTVADYTDTLAAGQDVKDPYRTLPKIDGKVCRTCHAEIGQDDNAESF